jgi:hypothetical protein
MMFYEPQTWSPMAVENCKLYTLYTSILSNPLHLTVGSKLILTQSLLVMGFSKMWKHDDKWSWYVYLETHKK